MKRLICILLGLALIVGLVAMIPVAASADSEESIALSGNFIYNGDCAATRWVKATAVVEDGYYTAALAGNAVINCYGYVKGVNATAKADNSWYSCAAAGNLVVNEGATKNVKATAILVNSDNSKALAGNAVFTKDCGVTKNVNACAVVADPSTIQNNDTAVAANVVINCGGYVNGVSATSVVK